MASKSESSVRSRELGGELVRIRERAGLTGDALAKILHWSPSKVSRVESGKRGTREVDIAVYAASCGLKYGELEDLLALAREADTGYWVRPHEGRLPDELRTLIVQENSASTILSYEPLLVPGLLQTEDYMRVLFEWDVHADEHDVVRRSSTRLARQSLLRRRYPPQCTFFIRENVLREAVGSAKIMQEQVLKLIFFSDRPQCIVRIVPSDAGPVGVLGGPFRIMHHDDHPSVVYTAGYTTSLLLEKPAEIAIHRTALTKLDQIALDGGQSRHWLATLASYYD
ncbi:helix-turn-helix domain-containing protein [Amycolatopsis nigrescens]|uniref:helix-turn-helix domain-containing protein n=1 Tax=Amycolatopsis nigrescens TaxID=381445 RepID=UPI0003A6E148|nr:helix-turn-helix transcriptional regulator [Amycolatopsis nigrescens]